MSSIIILGIIQGIAEFLPISSSAHLIIFRDIFGIGSHISNDITMSFDIAVHFGTLLAIIIVFFKELWNILIKGFTKGIKDKDGRKLWYLAAATLPAALVGVLFEDYIDRIFRKTPIIIAIALIIMGIIIYLVDKKMVKEKSFNDITLKDSIIIGCSQVFALIPGFSRSGTTIAAARCMKIDRKDAAKFSFFLSVPIVLGAVVWHLIKNGFDNILLYCDVFLVGTISSFIMGLICIKFLLKYLKKNDFKLFMWYRIILGLVVILKILF